MKHFASIAMSVLFTLIATTGFSQNNSTKPKQFNSFPEMISCNEGELAKIFNTAAGEEISLAFSNNFVFRGHVKNSLVKYSNLHSVVIESPEYSNTIFSVSKITGKDGSISYTGRIINKSFFDGFRLIKDASGNYQLTKIENDRVIADCAQL